MIFIKKVKLSNINNYKVFKKTYYKNLINLIDISITLETIYLIYKYTGLSLREIKDHDCFLYNRISIITIYKEILKS